MGVRLASLLLGFVYIIFGISGILPTSSYPVPDSFPTLIIGDRYSVYFAVFPINVMLTYLHMLLGLWGVLAYHSLPDSYAYAKIVGITFLVLALFGLIPVLNVFFGWMPLFGNNIWLHAATGAILVYFGFFYKPSPEYVTET